MTKRILLTLFLIITLLFQNSVSVLALEPPTAPSPPVAPTAPTAPTAPEAPKPPEAPPSPSKNPDPDPVPVEPKAPAAASQPEVVTGKVGDNTITTGDATVIVGTTTTGNTNTSNDSPLAGEADNLSSPLAGEADNLSNTDNGTGSSNNIESNSTTNNTTAQANTADVTNAVSGVVNTGDNVLSKNTGGNAAVITGDANISGAVVTAVNTNLSGVTVAQFNVADNHTGDIILTAQNASNVSNGANSINNASATIASETATFQDNTATVSSNLILAANSGDNQTSQNTNGDSSITTGNANVSGSAINFVNNNASGGVLYNIVNVYGLLRGDIILPESELVNAGNGNNSTNNATVATTSDNTTTQTNAAEISNNLILSASTGDNKTDQNTNGNVAIETGQANVTAKTLTVANANVSATQPLWVVLVNEAGKWVGKILGTPEGTTLASSNNGSVSVTDGSVTTTTNTTTLQNNLAKVVTELNLSANTGNNTASKNTGGDSKVQTGDATVIASIANFINNNIAGDSKLIVTVVNIFGGWLGDFVGPGQTKETKEDTAQTQDPGPNIGGGEQEPAQEITDDSPVLETVTVITPTHQSPSNKPFYPSVWKPSAPAQVLSSKTGFSDAFTKAGGQTNTTKKVNLAWLLFILPLLGIYAFSRRLIKNI